MPPLLATLALCVMNPAQEPHAAHSLPELSAQELAALPPDGGDDYNRLVFSKSPYLLQHATNPVDWYEWGPEAFAAAAERDVPVFLSIGYSTCHWCHVMAHESFEDEDVARLMNEAFVCVKLDREERPDIDQLYMSVTQALTGSGGWPMTVVMTPDRRPFFAGTYFPRRGRAGRPGMLQLVPTLRDAWDSRRDEVVESAAAITARIAAASTGSAGRRPDARALQQAERALRGTFDAEHGGFGATRKFPIPHEQRLLLRRHASTGDPRLLAMVERTLGAWRLGGVFDHVGLGIHRYSTDREWLLPHFEKMLYDQALCVLAYVDAFRATGDRAHEAAARDVLAYVSRVLSAPKGGFYSAEDADSEGEEGAFYVWTVDEVRSVLGDEGAAFVIERFGLETEGNLRDEATGRRTGANVLRLRTPLTGDERARWEPLRAKLFTAREERPHPLRDDKVLTDWNGLAIEAYARAGQAFGDDALVERARRGAAFLRAELLTADGRLHKRWRAGEAGLMGMLEDYAYAASGLVALFEAGHDPSDLALAMRLCDAAVGHFWDDASGGFFLSPDDGEELFVRAKEPYDGARPSGNSVMAATLLRIARITGETAYEERALATLDAFAGELRGAARAHTHLAAALDASLRGGRQIVVVGEPGAEDTRALLRAASARAGADDVLVLRRPGPADSEAVAPLVRLCPYTAAQRRIEGRAAAYVCVDFACREPVTSPRALAELLAPVEPGAGAEPGSGAGAEGR
ncbi:MAG: thioredoxin domain-containing protein [Planctomycetota bacterium]